MPPTIPTARGRVCAGCGGPLTQHRDGSLRCTPCRTTERARQRDHQDWRETRTQTAANKATSYERRLDAGETLTINELADAVTNGLELDFGDDYATALAADPRYHPTPDELREANALFHTGAAQQILTRHGISARQFALRTGCTPRAVGYWLTGTTQPKSAKGWPAATRYILDLKTDIDEQDAVLTSHGHKPTAQAWKAFQPHKPWDLTEPSKHCDGCRIYRQRNKHRYG